MQRDVHPEVDTFSLITCKNKGHIFRIRTETLKYLMLQHVTFLVGIVHNHMSFIPHPKNVIIERSALGGSNAYATYMKTVS